MSPTNGHRPNIDYPLVYLIPLIVVMTLFALGLAVYCLLTRGVGYTRTGDRRRMSPDTLSSLFPDRPIRPLPRRRLRERLSPHVADSITYPPSPNHHAPLFYYPPYTVREQGSPGSPESTSPNDQARRGEQHGRNYTPRREETTPRGGTTIRSVPEIYSRAARSSRQEQPRHSNPQPPPSTTSSVDGYDAFENTNNKKKRKIPSAGDSSLSSSHLLNTDSSSLSATAGAHTHEVKGDRPYAHSAGYSGTGSFVPSGQGMSGSGRGRLARARNARSPLRALTDGNNTWAGRGSKSAPQWAPTEHEGGGIISNAIANAEKLPPQGQENVSLLQQHSAAGKTPSTQFTFTCDSQVPGTVQWPGQSSKSNMGTQTGLDPPPAVAGPSAPSSARQATPPTAAVSGPPIKERRPTRREVEKELRMAARERRRLAAERNRASPPKKEEIWICEFCEYEDIFGKPPAALIRHFELRDRKLRQKLRQEEIDRKKLREKAKSKSRKSKKNGKLAVKGGQAVDETNVQSRHETMPDPGGSSSRGSHAPPRHDGNGNGAEDNDGLGTSRKGHALLPEKPGIAQQPTPPDQRGPVKAQQAVPTID